MLAVRGETAASAFFDTAPLREIGTAFPSSDQISYFGAIGRPVQALAFSPDGRTLVAATSHLTGCTTDVTLVDARTHRRNHVARVAAAPRP